MGTTEKTFPGLTSARATLERVLKSGLIFPLSQQQAHALRGYMRYRRTENINRRKWMKREVKRLGLDMSVSFDLTDDIDLDVLTGFMNTIIAIDAGDESRATSYTVDDVRQWRAYEVYLNNEADFLLDLQRMTQQVEREK